MTCLHGAACFQEQSCSKDEEERGDFVDRQLRAALEAIERLGIQQPTACGDTVARTTLRSGPSAPAEHPRPGEVREPLEEGAPVEAQRPQVHVPFVKRPPLIQQLRECPDTLPTVHDHRSLGVEWHEST